MDLLTRLKALPILLHCLPHISLPEVWWSNNKLALSLSLSLSLLLLLLLLSRFSRVQLCATPETAAYQLTSFLCPWDSPGKNTGVGCHFLLQCMRVKSESESEVAQLCPTPIDPMDCSLPGCSVHGIFQARVLEWGAIAFSALSPLVTTNLFSISVSLFLFCK